MSALQLLQTAINSALSDFDLSAVSPDVLQVVPATNPQFGDYQWNGALPLDKALKTNPRALATQILEKLDVSQIAETPEIAGPGFINFRLKTSWIESAAQEAAKDARLGVPKTENPRTVVVDFSSPNVAKQMHVGHIRSTIIGDAIARLLRFAGHKVITDNHIGDWGTAFGRIIVGWKDLGGAEPQTIGEIEALYKKISAEVENDPQKEQLARDETAALQSGNEENLAIWRRIIEVSQREFDAIYARLGVSFDHTLGESFYNPQLGATVAELKEKGIAQDSEGAVIIAFDEPKLAEKPMLIQKSDGAALYATTDLATIRYRAQNWGAQEILYVVDARQSLHFQQLFEAAKRWGYGDLAFRHLSFGSILGEDNRPIKTRSGESIKLKDLLDEAEERAAQMTREKNSEFSEKKVNEIGRVLGIGAVKYGDLAQNRSTDYVFSWDKMLTLTGNSAVYLENAYVRTRSLRRKAIERGVAWPENAEFQLQEIAEINLAKHLLRFGEAIEAALSDYRPHLMCDYLYELAGKYAAFWRDCPVLDAPSPARESRMSLVQLSGDVLGRGLELLGLETMEQM